MKKSLYHYGNHIKEQKTITIMVTKKSNPVTIDLSKLNSVNDIDTIEKAIAYLLAFPIHLMRVSGYRTAHNKIYPYSFHNHVTFTTSTFFALKNKKEVILVAKYLFLETQLNKIIKGLSSLLWKATSDKNIYTAKTFIHTNFGKEAADIFSDFYTLSLTFTKR